MMTQHTFETSIASIITNHARHCDDVVHELRAELAAALGKIGPGRLVPFGRMSGRTALRDLRKDLVATVAKIDRVLGAHRRRSASHASKKRT